MCEQAFQQSELHQEELANLGEEADELRRVAQSMSGTVTAIEAIEPPARDAPRVREGFFSPARALAASLRDLSGRADAALRAGKEDEAARAVERSLEPDENEKALRSFAAAYGFRTCAGE
ncbi:hypothetical protein ABZ897_07950 [Nonomuraea sp. NPDC046802]|uniref:hypothetical protein n=1 Tax=Nonomuraea sp. NPDC046802 TaxID=3154919 RepID=UPI00340B1517